MAKKSPRTTNETPTPVVQSRRENVKSPAFFSIYANDVQLRISLQLAKTLSKIMLDQIHAYEERFGPIPEIPGILT